MEGKRLIHMLQLKNFLSYGSDAEPIILRPLNVLIGPNASGKSNLIEAISLLEHTPVSGGISGAIRNGGGIGDILWKGKKEDDPVAEIETSINYPDENTSLRYKLSFTRVGQGLQIIDEIIENERQLTERTHSYYRYQNGNPIIGFRNENGEREEKSFKKGELRLDESILSQRRDPDTYPEITYLGNEFRKIEIFKGWIFRKNLPPRVPLGADFRVDFLEEGGENLALVLNNLPFAVKKRVSQYLGKAYPAAEQVDTRTQANTVQIYVYEKELNEPIPATRLSDGTLRYLCLLTILCHPNPPPLICIEEPELGLHPDILPTIAELLVEASTRTQLIVTTHSDILVSALTKVPESVIVCEHDATGTHLRRLDQERLKEWLDEYTLGELWLKGEIGGTRW